MAVPSASRATTLSEPIAQPATSSRRQSIVGTFGNRRFQRRVQVAVRHVQAEMILADLGGTEGHDRAADQPPRRIDDPHNLQRCGLRLEGGKDAEPVELGECRRHQRGRAPGLPTEAEGPARVTGKPRSASAAAAIRPVGPVPATMIRPVSSVPNDVSRRCRTDL